MDYNEYAEMMRGVEMPETLEFCQAVLWLRPETLPLGLLSPGGTEMTKIKVPQTVLNRFGRCVPVVRLAQRAFRGNTRVTDVVLPTGMQMLTGKPFAGCVNLKNIVFPKRLKRIPEGAFEGCDGLENVWYEGTREEWEALQARTPAGNEALFRAQVRFGCEIEKTGNDAYAIPGRDLTDLLRRKKNAAAGDPEK